jgi:hypothetical protein
MANNAADNELRLRQQMFNEATGFGHPAQEYLPQFGIDQGNVGQYKAPDIYGATQQTYEDELARAKAKKPGLFQQLLPVAGSIAGSYFGGKR